MKLHYEETELVVAIMKRIWHRGNAFVLKNKFEGPQQLILATAKGLEEFKQAPIRLQDQFPTSGTTRSFSRWHNPGERVVKVNWDATVETKAKRVGIGAIVGDLEGAILVIICAKIDSFFQHSMAKTIAVRRAIELCVELSFSSVISEGDAQAVIKVFNSREKCWTWNI